MDIANLKDVAIELMKALKTNGLGEVEIENDDIKIKVKAQPPARVMGPMPMTAPNPVTSSAAPVAAQAASDETSDAPGAGIEGTQVKSPMVGTFYSSPSPDAPPFVLVGQEVSEGDTLFIIEAMKTMNEVKAPCGGTVATVLAQSGDMVEYNQTVMVIK